MRQQPKGSLSRQRKAQKRAKNRQQSEALKTARSRRSRNSSAKSASAQFKKKSRKSAVSHERRRLLYHLTPQRLQDHATGIISRAERKLVRRRLAQVAVALTFLGALIAGLGNYLTLDSTPERAVNSYLRSLQHGNYLNGVDRSVYRDPSTVLLKNSMYRAATDRIEDYEVLGVQESGSTAQAAVRIRINGQDSRVDLPLKRVPQSGIFNDSWRPDFAHQTYESLGSQVPLDSVAVNGIKLSLGGEPRVDDSVEHTSWNIPLLPGTYEFSMPDDSYYALTTGPQKVTVGIMQKETNPVELKVRPSPKMVEETEQSIQSWINLCTQSRSLNPADCPSSLKYSQDGMKVDPSAPASASTSPTSPVSSASEGARIRNVQWKLISRPTLSLKPGKDASHWVASQHAPAVFQVSYTVDDEEQVEKVSVNIQAEVVSTGDRAEISAQMQEGSLKAIAEESPTNESDEPSATESDDANTPSD